MLIVNFTTKYIIRGEYELIMGKFMDRIADNYFKIYLKLEKNKYLSAIKQAFIMMIPIFMIGSLAILLQNFPIEVVRKFFNTALNGYINAFLNLIYTATFGFASVYVVITLTYQYSCNICKNPSTRVFAIINSLVCYFALLGSDVLTDGTKLLEYTNMTNVFSSLITSLISTRLFFLWLDFIEKKKDKTLYNSSFFGGLHSLAPIAICVAIFSLIACLIACLPIDSIMNFNDLVIYLLSKPFEFIGATYGGGLLILFIESFLWMFGIHGNNVFETINNNVFKYGNGKIVTKAFFDTYVLLGGCGATLCLLIALLIFSKSKRKKKLGYMSSVPMLFNVNEIMVFGLPIVLNPIYIIPFILTPLVNFSIAYVATATGMVPVINNPDVFWTTPVILSGFQATNSIRGSLLQVFCLAVGVGIYIPFVKLNNIISEKDNNVIVTDLINYVKNCEANKLSFNTEELNVLEKQYVDGIASKLSKDILNENITVFYQPQVMNDKIISLEGLLRFKYKGSNYIYPPLIINIANEKNLFVDLTKVIIKKSIENLKLVQNLKNDFSVAINIKFELLMDNDFRKWFIDIIHENKIPKNTFGIEITEEANLSEKEKCTQIFYELHENGILIFMDDFSMGNTSISVLENNHFDYVKLDGHLVQNLGNERSNEIVSTIIELGEKLHFDVIAEYVETEEQKNILDSLGCNIHQGYYYYKALPFNEIYSFIEKENKD